MPSLSEVYDGNERAVSLRRLTFGLGLFAAGSLLVVLGVVVATTGLVYGSDLAALTAKRQLGGILAGVGVPAVFLGVFAVLPSGRLTKAAAVVGAGIGVVGVALFTHAYPCRWSGSLCGAGKPDLTLATVGLYSLGVLLTFWCLFVGVANFKTRNDPGGTAMVIVTRRKGTKYVPVERPSQRTDTGGIGFFGNTPGGEVETQTGGTASDGGTASAAITSPLEGTDTAASAARPDRQGGSDDGEIIQRRTDTSTSGSGGGSGTDRGGGRTQPTADAAPADVYCGNCAHFEYVRTDEGIQPYCGAHDELMDDMDACDQWASRSSRRR